MDIPDKIEKRVLIHASVKQAWQAVTDASEFSSWFGIQLKGDFAGGQTILGTFDKAFNEEAIIGHQKTMGIKPSKIRPPQSDCVFCTVKSIDPETLFSFHWVPYGLDAEADPENEPTTLVEFRFEKAAEGTLLTITESGFSKVPGHRRDRAFRMNEGGWTVQSENIKSYIEKKYSRYSEPF